MKEYSDIEVRRIFPIDSLWKTKWGDLTVIDHVPDHDGMGYIVAFKLSSGNKMNIHPHFVQERIY